MSLDDPLKLPYFVALVRVVQPLMLTILQLLTNNSNNLKQLLFALPGYSNTTYKVDFTPEERKHLENSPDRTYDITLLFKLLQRVCGLAPRNDVKWSTDGTLEYHLRSLKNHRNEVFHNDVTLTQEELRSRFKHLEDQCRAALLATSRKIHRYLDDDIRVTEERLDEVLRQGMNLWALYKESLRREQRQPCNILVRVARHEICTRAARLTVQEAKRQLWDIMMPGIAARPVMLPRCNSENTFRSRSQCPSRSRSRSRSCSPLQISREAVSGSQLPSGVCRNNLTTKSRQSKRRKLKFEVKLTEVQELLMTQHSPEAYPDVWIIESGTGQGQILVRFLLKDWASPLPTVNGIYNFDLAFLVDLEHVDTCNSFEEMLFEKLLPLTCRDLTTSDVTQTLKELSVLWLVDGFDSDSKSAKKVLKKMLKNLRNSKAVIPAVNPDMVRDVADDLHLTHVTCAIEDDVEDLWKACGI